MTPELLGAIARGDVRAGSREYAAEDPKAQTGLGLALVKDAAEFRGGRLVAGRSSEGGALVLMALPHTHHSTRSRAPSTATGSGGASSRPTGALCPYPAGAARLTSQ